MNFERWPIVDGTTIISAALLDNIQDGIEEALKLAEAAAGGTEGIMDGAVTIDKLDDTLKDILVEYAFAEMPLQTTTGYYDYNSGLFNDTYTNAVSARVDCKEGEKYRISATSKYAIATIVYFNEDGTVSKDGLADSVDLGETYTGKEIIIPAGCVSVAFQTHASGTLKVEKYKPSKTIRDCLVDMKQELAEVSNNLSALEYEVGVYGYTDITNELNPSAGYYTPGDENGNGGGIWQQYDSASSVTLDCCEGDKFKVSGKSLYHVAVVIYFNSANTYIGHSCLTAEPSIGTLYTDEEIIAPADCAKVAFQTHVSGALKVEKYEKLKTLKELVKELNNAIDAKIDDLDGSVQTNHLADGVITADKLDSNLKKQVSTIPDKAESAIEYFLPVDSLCILDAARYQISSNKLSFVSGTAYAGWQTFLLPCVPGDTFKITGYIPTNYSTAAAAIFADESGSVLASVGRGGTTEDPLIVETAVAPEGATQVSFSSYHPAATIGVDLRVDKLVNSTVSEDIIRLIQNVYNNPLYGKKLYVDGDSVAQGDAAYGTSYADIIAYNNSMTLTKNAKGGTTIAVHTGNGSSKSIYERVTSKKAQTDDEKYDYILLEGGFNDVFKSVPLGSLTEGYNGSFDTSTTIGAIEAMCKHLLMYYFDVPKLFVLGHRHTEWLSTQGTYWDGIKSALEKWGIPYVDLRYETNLMLITGQTEGYFDDGDGTHPTRKTYNLFYVPIIEKALTRGSSNKNYYRP